MKTIIFLLVAFVFIACEKDKNHENTDINLLPKVKSAYLITASNQFTFDLLKKTDSLCTGHNALVSPLSVQGALSMTLNGAAGKTYSDMSKVLGFENAKPEEINNYNQSLFNALLNADLKVTFEVANSIWCLKDYPFQQKFIEVNQSMYNAEVKTEDFSDPQTLEKINNWTSNKTHGKIPEILDYIDPNAVMYLLNALYFKGNWKYEFDKSKTSEQPFFKADGSEVKHTQMSMEATIDYYSGDGVSLVALPYGEAGFRMIIILADESIASFVNATDGNSWKNLTEKMIAQKVRVSIPKFKFEFKSLLNKPLTDLGMGVAFSDYTADFTNMTPINGIYISRVIHKTFIDVNEEGTEAAAVTAVEMNFKSVGPINDIATFNANRPFLYFIEEKSTGSIIFAGIMNDPNESKYELK